MPILVMCRNPECCELFQVSEETSGAVVRCPVCGTEQRREAVVPADRAAPAPPEPTAETPVALEDDMLPALTPVPVPPPAPRAPSPPQPPRSPTANRKEVVLVEDSEPPIEAFSSPAPVSLQVGTPPEEDRSADRLFEMLDETDACGGKSEEGDLLTFRPIVLGSIAVGVMGIAIGLFLGVRYLPWSNILNAYVGGGIGWVAGFIIAFLMIVGHQGETRRVRCASCGAACPAQAATCGLCGAQLTSEGLHPLTWMCLRAGAYAWKDRLNFVVLLWPILVAYPLLRGTVYILLEADGFRIGWEWGLVGINVVMGFLIFSHWLRYGLDIVDATRKGQDIPPSAPSFGSRAGLGAGVRGLGATIVYVLPLFTLPLLPLGLLLLTAPRLRVWLNIPTALRAVGRYTKDFVLLWLFLLVWSSALVLAALVVYVLFYLILDFIPGGDDWTWLREMVLGLNVLALAVVGVGLVGTVFRCVGLFGRFCSRAFRGSFREFG